MSATPNSGSWSGRVAQTLLSCAISIFSSNTDRTRKNFAFRRYGFSNFNFLNIEIMLCFERYSYLSSRRLESLNLSESVVPRRSDNGGRPPCRRSGLFGEALF